MKRRKVKSSELIYDTLNSWTRWRPTAILDLVFDFVVAGKWHHGLSVATSTPNLVKISEAVAELWRFSFFQNGSRPQSWILFLVKNDVAARCGLSMSTTVANLVTISEMAAEILRFSFFCDFPFFQNGGQPPAWILSLPKNNIMRRCGLYMATSTPNLVKLTQIAAELWRFSFFFKMAANRHLGFCYWSKVTQQHVADCPFLPTCQIWWQYLKWRPSYCDFRFFK